MYFGSTIMTFALPYGAFIAATIALYYLFRARHSGPRLRWSADAAAQIASVTTREPGPAPAPDIAAAAPAMPAAAAVAAETSETSETAEAPAPADAAAADETAADRADGTEADGQKG